MVRTSVWLALLAGCSVTCAVVPALEAQQTRPAFEVASIKRLSGPPRGITAIPFGSGPRPGGILDLRNTTVARLIMYAYDVANYQVDGGPEWSRVDRFDVSGRAGGEVPVATLRLMVQSLLADRFGLRVHEIQRDMPVYAMVLARADQLGPNLKKNDDDCKTKVEMPNVPDSSPSAIRSSGCGPLSSMLASASAQMNAPVVDKTGLTGNYQLSYYYDGQGTFFGEPGGAPIPTRDPSLPLYQDALREQLGLKLEPSRGLVRVIVVDSVQPPTDN